MLQKQAHAKYRLVPFVVTALVALLAAPQFFIAPGNFSAGPGNEDSPPSATPNAAAEPVLTAVVTAPLNVPLEIKTRKPPGRTTKTQKTPTPKAAKDPNRAAKVQRVLDEYASQAGEGTFAFAAYQTKPFKPIASVNGDMEFVMASTYKLFVGLDMAHAVQNGERSWNEPFLGTTLGECFDAMFLYSDNDCPEEWLLEYDVAGIDAIAEELGATSTDFSVAFVSTAEDIALPLRAIYEGTGLTKESRQKFLDSMLVQETRDGLPAGIGEAGRVADKVGYLRGYLHDAGIVFSDKGDFIMVALTDNLSWDYIAEVSGAVFPLL